MHGQGPQAAGRILWRYALTDQIIPDDHPGEGLFMTLKDIAQILSMYMTTEGLNEALDMLDAGEQVALTSPGTDQVLVAFTPAGTGLFRAYINEGLISDDNE